ncbi:MAG: hypothetical protein Q9174_002438 [Haloplaca sp. 1 TL-2023]
MDEDEDAETVADEYATRLLSIGEPFTTRIFQVIVGPDKTTFNVHSFFLQKSPVFARMCQGDFKESSNGVIELPEDDSITFSIFLEYLYTGTILYQPYFYKEEQRPRTIINFAHLYLMADKYALNEMKPLIVGKLSICYISPQADQWLPVAEIICASIPTTDDVYTNHLRALVRGYRAAWNTKTEKMKVFEEPVEKGGRLALEINRAFWSS